MSEIDAEPWIHVNTIQHTMDHEDANLYLRKGWILLGRTMTHEYILGWIKRREPEYPEQSIHVRARQYSEVINNN
jgi:hypothetical protein